MGGGRDNTGASIYRRVNGVYVRRDGKPVKHRNVTIESFSAMQTATEKASETPLPQNGRQVASFLQNTMALDNLNDSSTGNSLSRTKRNSNDLYGKLIDGRIETPNGGFIYQDRRGKNDAYMKYNNMPDLDSVMSQVIPQLTPANLKQVIPANDSATIDGNTERANLWVYETQVINNLGESIRTYVKIYPFHSNEGKPYTILVSLHRTGPVRETATAAQKG